MSDNDDVDVVVDDDDDVGDDNDDDGNKNACIDDHNKDLHNKDKKDKKDNHNKEENSLWANTMVLVLISAHFERLSGPS